MKTVIKHTFVIFLVVVFFSACGDNKGTKEDVENTPLLDKVSYESQKIEHQDAEDYINDYRDYIDDVRRDLADSDPTKYPNDKKKLNYGSWVRLGELREVLLNANFKDDDQLYLMNGIKGDSTEIFFSLRTSQKGPNQDSIWLSFDFTRPCPTGCPDWFQY